MNLNRTRFTKVYECGIVLRIIMVIILSFGSSATAATLTVCPISCSYPSIQDAINASTTGDTIAVQSGVYFEQVNVTKRLTLRGSILPAKPQIIAGGSGSAITLSVNGIILDGFIATNGNEGISVISSNNTIKNNSAVNNVVGIHLVSAKNNTLSGNTVNSNTQKGIVLDSSHNNILSKNAANSNTGGSAGNYGMGGSVYGIYLYSSTGNTLNSNSANSNTGGSAGSYGTGGSGYGIYLDYSTYNNLNNNFANSNTGGSATGTGWGGTGGSGYGIYLSSSTGNILNNNSANSNTGGSAGWYGGGGGIGGSGYGIYLTSATGNALNDNSANSNTGGSADNNHWGGGYGIYFISYSSSNTMIENNVSSNRNYNIVLSSSNMNLIYHNNLHNSNNAYDNSANSWDNGAEGNYYSNYAGSDSNNDGIGDTTYPISGGSNVDHYPLMKPYNPPPASITGLKNTSYNANYIKWTWIDPQDSDFDRVMVYINGVFKKNVSKGVRLFNATNLNANTLYMISTHTVDTSGNINKTWMNRTARTAPITAVSSIAVVSPNGGENWTRGTTQTIRWTSSGTPGSLVNITLLKGGVFNRIINSSTPNDESYAWKINSTQALGTNYKVKVTSTTNPAYSDTSNNNFTISVPISCNISTIYGYSFNDTNNNKTKDIAEVGLSNRTINLKGYNTCTGTLVSKTIKTNPSGYFAFKNVNAGTYVLSEDFVLHWLPTTDAAFTLRIPSNSVSIRKDFGNKKFP